MGKKIIFGCLGVGLLVLIVGGYLFYSMVWKPITGSLDTLKEIHETNEQIVDRTPYHPPPTGELTQNQVERFVAVQTDIRQGLEARFAEFEKKYEELNDDLKERDPSFREIMNILGDIAKLYADAKQIQVDALNREGFSLEEYRFVQSSFYQALNVELFAYNLDMIAKAASEGVVDLELEEYEDQKKYQRDEVPEKNRELVAPYADSADAWITFAWWGL